MVDITITDTTAIFHVRGWDQFWAMKSQIEIPLAHIADVHGDSQAARGYWHGLRMPGTQIPGVIIAGTFFQMDGRTFFDVHNADNAIVVVLDHEKYKELVVEVEDPDIEIAKFRAALAAFRK